MKINISGLMNVIKDEERRFNLLSTSIQSHIYNTEIQELNGNVNIIEDYKKDFEKEVKEYKETLTKISKLKSTLYEKNNQFKLSDGRTIQEAIIDNTNLRKMKTTYEIILNFRNSKRRVTEVNNSYFECKTVNFDVDSLRTEAAALESIIQKTDFEISKLNSIEFEIDI